jgi:hypothetical protein
VSASMPIGEDGEEGILWGKDESEVCGGIGRKALMWRGASTRLGCLLSGMGDG